MDFFSLTQNIYKLDYRNMVEKLHYSVHVYGMGIDMGLKWAKDKERAGSYPSCPALGGSTLQGGCLLLSTTVLVPIPMY